MKRQRRTIVLSAATPLLLFIVAACNAAPPTVAPPSPPAVMEPVATTDPTLAPEPTRTSLAISTPAPPAIAAAAAPTPEPTLSPVERILAVFPDQPQATGQVVLLFGRVLATNGDPIPGAAVEIWQTDAQGIYDHPGDRSTAGRDRAFQFYGTSTTGADGVYVFRTLEPGYYEPRPKHIHVKVKIDGRETLTTQFYFEEDRAGLAGEGVFSQAGGQGERLILKEIEAAAARAAGIRVLSNDLVLKLGGGSLPPTPAQAEGPYYPVVDVSSFDNDLSIVP
jgi:protocatechuate 3,4-dioxygenase beta subunit